jgi:hypothetical protein
MSAGDIVPDDLATHPQTVAAQPTGNNVPPPSQPVSMQGQEVPAQNMQQQPSYTQPESAFTPDIGGAVGTGVGAAAGTGLAAKKAFLSTFGPKSLQNYANSQIGNQYNVPLPDLEKEVGFKLQTMPEVQAAVKKISRSEATPEIVKPIYKLDSEGNPVISHYEKTPGTPASEGIDLSKYKKGPMDAVKKYGSPIARGAVAGYDIGRGLENPTSLGGAGDIAAGGTMAIAPFLPEKVGKIPLRALANAVGAIPAVKGAGEYLYNKIQGKAEGGSVKTTLIDTLMNNNKKARKAVKKFKKGSE